MCYDIKTSLEAQLIKARRKGDQEAIKQIMEKLAPLTDLPIYHASGFQHPRVLVYTPDDGLPVVSHWGLIPHWVRDWEQAQKLRNNTLNARGETLFEKPSFREAFKKHRCLIFVDGFYEHHHFHGKTYPYFIHQASQQPICLGGLYSEWLDRSTGELIHSFTIVTTPGNELLSQIHNNPKMKGPRMPLILQEAEEDRWLFDDVTGVQELIEPDESIGLNAHTVQRLRGSAYRGNVPESNEEFLYPELLFQ